MAHFKCPACRARIWRDGDAGAHSRDLCPGGAGPLEAVVRAEEIIGLRAFRTRPRPDRSLADQIRETIARNDAARAWRLRLAETDRQPDDGD